MLKRNWTVYVVHHSHTDIGYTDLQENIIFKQIQYIRDAVRIAREGYKAVEAEKFFKWNCETLYCVEKFLEEASDEEKREFFSMIRAGNIGISASYLNFTDLVDRDALDNRTREMLKLFRDEGIDVKTAMIADINGISLGAFQVLLENGIEFLYANIHTHHGMYPLYKNQLPFFWEGRDGKKLLVFSGEHYHLGNSLGLAGDDMAVLRDRITAYLQNLEEDGYEYDFVPISVSGVQSDNAPPNKRIVRNIMEFNESFGKNIRIEMVTLQELYEKIMQQLKELPAYRGDLTDWWANGIASTPYAVKHYKEAQWMYRLCRRLDPEGRIVDRSLLKEAEENLLLYAEHTWGYCTATSNPYNTMVLNLDMRKSSYASKAHEACAKNLNILRRTMGDSGSYYGSRGKLKAVNLSDQESRKLVEFYIEGWKHSGIRIICEKSGKEMISQLSPHDRGVLISFIDDFPARGEKSYYFEGTDAAPGKTNTRLAYVGREQVRDVVNDYDPISYLLPYQMENKFFRICYELGRGVVSFYNKIDGTEMMKSGDAAFFTPIYELTEIRTDNYNERRKLGRNVRGLHAKKYIAELTDVRVLEQGKIFQSIELLYRLEGTLFCSVLIKMYHDLPRIDFKLKIAKKMSMDIESVYLPLSLHCPEAELYIDKSGELMRPGIDQIPGTCMEYYLADNGLVYQSGKNSILLNLKDAPLLYMGELKHHPILLCDNRKEYNKKDVYSWVMHNIWETNFKIDLSGIAEFCYTLCMVNTENPEQSFQKMKDERDGVITIITENIL